MLKISKILTAALATSLVSLSLVSCGGKTEKSTPASEDSTAAAMPSAGAQSAAVPADSIAEGLPTVIDFYATWCGPCKNIAPLFETLKEKYAGKANFVSVDVDADAETAARYHVEAMPTFVFLDADGKEVNRLVGADTDALTAAVEQLANP